MSKLKAIFQEFEETHPGARINQRELADRAGVRHDRLNLVVNGLVPDDVTKAKIAEALSLCVGKSYTAAEIWPEVDCPKIES